MNWKTLAIGSLLALGVAACKDNTPSAPPAPPAPPSKPPATATVTAPAPATASIRTPSDYVVPAVTAPALSMPSTSMPAMSMPGMMMPAMSLPAVTMPAATTPAATMAASAPAATASLTSTADGLLATATQAIKDKKWDIADGAVTQLENYKTNLPAEYGPRIDQVKTLLDGAKALTQPSLPTSLPGLRF